MTGEHFIRNGLPPDAPEVPDDEDSILQPTAHTTSGEASLNNDMEEDDDDATGSLETISLPQSTQLDEAATGADMSSELGVENDDENGTNEDDQSVDESILQRYLNRRIEVAGDDDDDASSLGGSVIAKRGKARTPAKKGVKRKASKGKAVPKKKKGKTVASDTAGAPVDAEEGNDSDSSLGSEGPTPSKRMTARQLAKLHGGIELGEMDLELADERPSKRKQYTAEEIALRKSENARRRKHQADTRAEEAKINTINKLLRKQATKKRAKEEDPRDEPPPEPTKLRYVQRADGHSLSVPETQVSILPPPQKASYPEARICAVDGCGKPKKYRSITAGVDVCGMDHWKLVEARMV